MVVVVVVVLPLVVRVLLREFVVALGCNRAQLGGMPARGCEWL